MKLQVTVDTLITAGGLMAVAVVILAAFYGLYVAAERGVRKGHLEYLSRVIEDRMSMCEHVEGVKVYAPYEVNVLCGEGKVCWRDLCVDVECEGGGTGNVFVVEDCEITPYRGG